MGTPATRWVISQDVRTIMSDILLTPGRARSMSLTQWTAGTAHVEEQAERPNQLDGNALNQNFTFLAAIRAPGIR